MGTGPLLAQLHVPHLRPISQIMILSSPHISLKHFKQYPQPNQPSSTPCSLLTLVRRFMHSRWTRVTRTG
ncbi:hypothetical protein HanXRQr2_Chr15g0722291 [Helianthus annuus]|uniref:Uncharacterized protein n=1 Tax=Helianthus annuus TaxID=4232 RepID=A0A251SEL6_HELAN|nr:hypothetical protein HanXRQr2_Chr15g0722291 [Helianthus annuus]KAJ0833643.1 hypothetical protein HanPSC8_Chr15g0692761 [Helianthus annuus]